MTRLAALARTLGQDLSLPATSSKDAAAAMTQLAQAGLNVRDIMGATKGVLQLSAAANIDNAEAAIAVANALNAFSLKGTEATRIADLFASSVSASGLRVEHLADALQMSSAVFAAAHIPLQDLVTAVNELRRAGIAGSDAGTSLKQMLITVQAPSKATRRLMEEVGFSIYDASGQMKSMRDIILNLQKSTAGMTQEARDFALAQIFGSDAVRAANVLLAQGVDGWDAMSAAVNRQGTAAELAAARNKGLAGAIDGFKSAAETLAIDLGTSVLPVLTGWVRGLSETVNMLGTAGGAAKAFADGVTTAFGLSRKAVEDFGAIVRNNQTLFAVAAVAAGAAIAVALGPGSIAVGAIAFLTAALVGFNVKWDEVFNGLPVPVLRSLLDITTGFEGFVDAFRITTNAIIGGFNLILRAANAVAKATHIALAGAALLAGDFEGAGKLFQSADDVKQFDLLPTIPSDLTQQIRDRLNDALIASTNVAPKTFKGLTRDQLLGIDPNAQDDTTAAAKALQEQLKKITDASKGGAKSIDELLDAVNAGKAPLSDLEQAIKDLADRAAAASQRISEQHTSEVVEGFLKAILEGTDPDTAVAKIRATQADQDSVWAKLVGDLHDKLGVQIPDEFRSMWDQMRDAQEKAKNDLTNGWLQALKARLQSVGRLLPNGVINPNQRTVDQSITINGGITVHTDSSGRIDQRRLADDLTGAIVQARSRTSLAEAR